MRRFNDEPVGVEAAGLVTGQRQMDYGDPLVNYERFSLMLTAIFRTPVSRREAMHVLIALKMCRDLEHPLRDNEVDICGYAHLLQFDREQLEGEQVLDEDDEPEEKEEGWARVTTMGNAPLHRGSS